MPELPEVETTRRGLVPVMEGQVILRADIRRPDLRWPFPENMGARLEGARVLTLRRRAKYILGDLSTGETLIVHLGMSGRMLVHPQQEQGGLAEPGKHDHVVLQMSGGARITFNDARRFGAMDICARNRVAEHPLLAPLGPEPLGNEFNTDHLIRALAGRRMPIKSALLDQKIVAGLGNIYVCESLWRAGISPRRKAGNLSLVRVSRLVRAIRDVLNDAIDSGGSSLKDFRQTDGELGYFQHKFAVYGRVGQPCRTPDCKGTIQRIVQSGRSSFYCSQCQR